MTTNEYHDEPTILDKIDEGDEDCRLWVITAGYKDQTAEVSDRDWMRGERRALQAVREKVEQAERIAADHDFTEAV